MRPVDVVHYINGQQIQNSMMETEAIIFIETVHHVFGLINRYRFTFIYGHIYKKSGLRFYYTVEFMCSVHGAFINSEILKGLMHIL